LIEEDYLKGIT